MQAGGPHARAAGDLEFEPAARLRDRLSSVQKAIERQQMVADRSEDFDVFGLADDEPKAAVQVFFVRKGRVVGRKGFIVDKVEDLTPTRSSATCSNATTTTRPRWDPKGGFVPVDADDPALIEEWLSLHRGSRATARLPATRRQAFSSRDSDSERDARTGASSPEASIGSQQSCAGAARSLQDELELPIAPLRIECFDMSHIQGSDYVGSMVVMEDGLPKKSDYRRFKVKTVGVGNDDYAAMEEVLTASLHRDL